MSVLKSAIRKYNFLLLLFLTCASAFAQKQPKNISDAQKNKKKLNEEIKNLDAVLGQTKTSRNIAMLHVQTLNLKISKREELIGNINYEIKQVNGELETKRNQIKQLTRDLDTLKSRYSKLLKYAQKNNSSFNKLMFVFSSKDFNQAFQRINYMQEINLKRRVHADSIVSKHKRLLYEKDVLSKKAEEKNILLGSEEKEKGILAIEKDQQEVELSKLSEKEKKLKQELEEKKKDVLAIDKKIKEMIAEIALKEQREREEKERIKLEKKKKRAEELALKEKSKKSGGDTKVKTEKVEVTSPERDIDEELSADFAGNKGKLPWPVPNGVITEGFGPHQHPKIKEVTINNSGVDITSTTKNATARSVFGGEVTLIAPMPDGNSKILIIRHGTYLSVYTNLAKVFVKQGDKVSLKQSIGEILFNEESGGITLNLQIWKGQTKLNPEDWLHK
ncbi:MAG: murein hydrolase activator EnvC family protein [Bacteroidota bacterium]|jgi:septal ring factor EnvC (AmiA/AmiB activator)